MSSPLCFTYAIQDFNNTGPMRAPYMICKGFVRSGWGVEIVSTLNKSNRDMDLVWDSVPLRKVGNGSHVNGVWSMIKEMLRRRSSHITLSYIWNWHCYALLLNKILFGHPYALALDTYTHRAPWEKPGLPTRLRLELRYGIVLRNADIILADVPLAYKHARHYAKHAETLFVPKCLWQRELHAVEQQWEQEGFAPERAPVILYTGRILPGKGLHDLIAAFACLAERFPEWTIEIRGPSGDQAYFEQLQQLAAGHNLQERVQFLPSLSGEELYRRYRSCAIYCIPTYKEGMPTTITEAMYFGGAVVAGNAGHIDFQLAGGECGLLFEPGDVACLRAKLVELMQSEDKRKGYMLRARERVLSTFSWEEYFGVVEDAFKRHIHPSNSA